MDLKTRLNIIASVQQRYRKASKREKRIILNEIVGVTGYNRKHAIVILGKKLLRKKSVKRYRVSKYQPVRWQLRKLWVISNFASGKRLVPAIPTYLDALLRHKELKVKAWEKKLLLSISAATCDRLLKVDRKRVNIKGRSGTKPGTLLKHQIPIKMLTDWDSTVPGFLEIDSVHHCGGDLSGDYIYTLDTTDVATGWNECCAHLGKGEIRTVKALEEIRKRLPFPLLGIDFDCGGEFVNYHLIRYSKRNQITYTRAREGMKNDQNYIEQQNFSVVRRFAGYQRLDTEKQLTILNELYLKLSDYQNFFQPVMRLKEKIRDGAHVSRRYSKAKTAYQRVLESPEISDGVKQKLEERLLILSPLKLIREITNLGKKLAS